MTLSKLLQSALRVLLTCFIVLLPTVALAASPPPAQGVRITPIGQPTWEPVDFHLFSAPIGTADSGYVEFVDTALALLPEPNHVPNDDLMVGPGTAHNPPYNQEMAAGVAEQGYHEGVRFSQAEFSQGMGVWITWMNIPAPGTTGSSPDFDAGPIIPNSLFPIHVVAISNRNGQVFNPFVFDGNVPALDTVGFDVDGHSHFPMFIADNADFGPGGKLRGSYAYQITMLDETGNGWLIEAHFAVAP